MVRAACGLGGGGFEWGWFARRVPVEKAQHDDEKGEAQDDAEEHARERAFVADLLRAGFGACGLGGFGGAERGASTFPRVWRRRIPRHRGQRRVAPLSGALACNAARDGRRAARRWVEVGFS